MFGWGTFTGEYNTDQQWKLKPVETRSNHFRIQNVLHNDRFLLKFGQSDENIAPKICDDSNCVSECEEGKNDCDKWIIEPLYEAAEAPEYRDVFFFDNDQEKETLVNVKLRLDFKSRIK